MSTALNQIDFELVKVVAEDLEYLQKDWHHRIEKPNIRRGSAVLRRLLNEQAYSQAWNLTKFGKAPQVEAIDIIEAIGDQDTNKILIMFACGAFYHGLYLATYITSKFRFISQSKRAYKPNGLPSGRRYFIHEYTDSVCGVAEGIQLTRREVIRYFSNVSGGVHLGRKKPQRKDKEVIDKMKNFENVVDYGDSVTLPEGIDLLMLELVAIAQAIADSEDAQKFIDFAQSVTLKN